MPMLEEPWKKYSQFRPIELPNRQWPSKTIDTAPRWLAADLRHGNQDNDDKWKYFQMLVGLGYKEIELPTPSDSQADFDFTRRLIETAGAVPDDVWLQVPCSADENQIRLAVEAMRGAKKTILSLSLTSNESLPQSVLTQTLDGYAELAVKCTKLVRSMTKDDPEKQGTQWALQFSPGALASADPGLVLQLCEAVKAAWGPTAEDRLILNLPTPMGMSTPNVFADQVEHLCRSISEREKVAVSIRPSNDRGCAVAASEFGQMAGADRVEGCLFGNGEGAGDVDLVTLALNLYTQGVNPKVNFSDISSVIEVAEKYTEIPVHQRAPYGGFLVMSAFSGSHQDAIKKGLQGRDADSKGCEDRWVIPYLPLDPNDIGRTYEAVIRVNSQSGKGGAAWVILRHLQLDLPRDLQVEFSRLVQKKADGLGKELQIHEITEMFEDTYHIGLNDRFQLLDYSVEPDRSLSPTPEAGKTADVKNVPRMFDGVVKVDGEELHLRGRGNGPISALADALKVLGVTLDVKDYKEHSIGTGRDVRAASYLQCTVTGSNQVVWGVGVHHDVVHSSLNALLSAACNFASSRPGIPKTVSELVGSPQDFLPHNTSANLGHSTIVSRLEIQVEAL